MPLHDDYAAIREGAAIGSIAPRSPLAVAGNDRASYLQGLLTNDIQALQPGTGCYAAWLSPQGRMLTDLHVLASAGMILLDVPAGQAGSTLERLEQFIFTEDVRVESMAESLTSVWLHGPRATDALERALEGARGLASWAPYQHAQTELRGEPVSVARIDQLQVPGFCVWIARVNEALLVEALKAAGARAVSPEAIGAARIEAGYPVFGVDMTETTIPLEAGIEDRAISFNKGCYVGQEVIIRVLHRGGGRVAKKLVGLQVGPPGFAPRDLQPVPHVKIMSGEREIGEITSAAVSPGRGAIALGYVHRDFVEPGTAVDVVTGNGRSPALVTARPMPSIA